MITTLEGFRFACLPLRHRVGNMFDTRVRLNLRHRHPLRALCDSIELVAEALHNISYGPFLNSSWFRDIQAGAADIAASFTEEDR